MAGGQPCEIEIVGDGKAEEVAQKDGTERQHRHESEADAADPLDDEDEAGRRATKPPFRAHAPDYGDLTPYFFRLANRFA